MNIIITGHKGLIGSFLKKRLEDDGHKIVMGVDKKDGREVRGLRGFNLNREINVDMMIHCAALCKINKTIENPLLGHFNGLDSFDVFEFCRKNKITKIVYFSSSRVLSKEKNPYTAGKVYGEELCKAYKDCYGIDYLIIRPSTVYGDFWDETKRLMHIFIMNALQGKDLEIYGNPETKTLDFTYVGDFVDAVILAINSSEWNKDYNISGGQETKIYDLAKSIIEMVDSSSEIVVKDAEIAQPQEVRLDISAIRGLGYVPKVSLEEGVRKNVEFLRGCLESD